MSDRDTWPDNPSDLPREVPSSEPRSGFSGCFKVFLIVGALGFVTMLACCGAFGWLAYQSAPKLAKTPAEVSALAQQIVKLDIPADFQGDTGMSIDNPLLEMRFATFLQKEQKGRLLVGGFRVKVGDLAEQEKVFRAKATDESEKGSQLDVLKMETREFMVRGKKVPFRFSEAEERQTKKEYRLVEGELDVPGGGVFLRLVLEADAYDDAAVVKMIESIQ